MEFLRTIADHVLDIAQNSVNAQATYVKINFVEDHEKIVIKIKDNGCGINKEELSKIFDPFFTTHEEIRRVGLGLPFLKQNAELTGGYVHVSSTPKIGTVLEATLFKTIDCQPIGDLAGTFAALVTSSEKVTWEIERCLRENCYVFSSEDLEGIDLSSPRGIKMVFEYFKNMESSF